MDHAITRAAAGAAPTTPPPAGTPRRWALLLTSANHGIVGPAGNQFASALGQFERLEVVEVQAAAGAPADQVELRIVAAQAGQVALTELQIRKATDELTLPELAEQFAAVEALGFDYTLSAKVCGKLFRAMTTPPDDASGQVAVPEAAALDTARLNWIIAHPCAKLDQRGTRGGWSVWDRISGQTFAEGNKSARAALDEAMQASTAGERREQQS